jgi:hypothetical protein
MKLKSHYIGLILALVLVNLSFLFFGRLQSWYQFLLLLGLLFSAIFYLKILFGKFELKAKLISTMLIILAVSLNRLIEPRLIDWSYLIYLNGHNSELARVNEILQNKAGEISIFRDKVSDQEGLLLKVEENELLELIEKLDVYIISKTDQGVYYGLWGLLDVRLGVMFWTSTDPPSSNYRHLNGKWFH